MFFTKFRTITIFLFPMIIDIIYLSPKLPSLMTDYCFIARFLLLLWRGKFLEFLLACRKQRNDTSLSWTYRLNFCKEINGCCKAAAKSAIWNSCSIFPFSISYFSFSFQVFIFRSEKTTFHLFLASTNPLSSSNPIIRIFSFFA